MVTFCIMCYINVTFVCNKMVMCNFTMLELYLYYSYITNSIYIIHFIHNLDLEFDCQLLSTIGAFRLKSKWWSTWKKQIKIRL